MVRLLDMARDMDRRRLDRMIGAKVESGIESDREILIDDTKTNRRR